MRKLVRIFSVGLLLSALLAALAGPASAGDVPLPPPPPPPPPTL
jgi:hypothetical protein